MTGAPVRVLVADDHTIVRRGLVSLLSLAEGILVVAEAENGREAVEKALVLDPDVVLMDVSMPLLNGLEATAQIRKKAPRIRVLILSAHDNEEYLLQVAECGASGYLLKNSSAEELFRAIRSVHAGEKVFGPSLPASSHAEGSGAGPLTTREREILQLVAEGNHHQRIADLLNTTERA